MKSKKTSCCQHLSVCSFAIAIGVCWGLGMFLTAILAMLFGLGVPFVDLFSSIYIGFSASIAGAFLGLFWGFLDGFVGGAIIAFVYNYCCSKCRSK